MKIYTKTGDDGTTGLFDGSRVTKYDNRVVTYGTVDELNSAIGLAISLQMPLQMIDIFENLQNTLFNLGSDLATPLKNNSKITVRRITIEDIEILESQIDNYTAILAPLKKFILPGGSACASALHLARTICRRAERLCTQLSENEETGQALIYLNRLSDFLFTAARMANHLAGIKDTVRISE